MTKFARGGPAVSKKLIGRKAELEYLLERMKSKSVNYNVAVLGYRRIGKTSILMKLKEILEKEKQYAVVYFDVQKNMAEPKIFFTKLQKTIFDVYVEKLSATEKSLQIGKFFTNIVSAIQSKKITNIGAEVRPDGTIFPKFELGDKSDYGELFLSIFKTIKIFSEKSNIKFIVILDEFQDFRELDRYPGLKQIFDLFRACVQERGENVSYIISGSKIHLLNNILTNGDSPLFAHFEQCMVNEMEEKYARDFFKKYLKARKIKQTVNLDKKAYELVGGQPFYLMALAEVWNPKDDIKKVFVKILTTPLGSLKNYVDYTLTDDLRLAKGGPILRTILRALSEKEEGYTYTELAKKISTKPTKLTFYVPSLISSDLVYLDGKNLKIRDKIIRIFLKNEAAGLA